MSMHNYIVTNYNTKIKYENIFYKKYRANIEVSNKVRHDDLLKRAHKLEEEVNGHIPYEGLQKYVCKLSSLRFTKKIGVRIKKISQTHI